ncbi:MAG TPA: acyltransferase [Opitutaceae bacterium]|nr:acyltransferase [Opitutaceae bacterium]
MALPRREKLSSLELIRFGAAFTVLIAHYFHFYMRGYGYEGYAFEHQPLFGLLEPFYRYGTRAVEVFWILSGFIFFHQYAEVIQERSVSGGKFFWLRFSRLYPLHFVTLIAVALLQWAYRAKYGVFFIVELNDLRHFVLNLLFASYWGFQHGFSFNTPAWSVSVEVLVYFLFFVVTRRLGASLVTVLLCLGASAGLNFYLGSEPVINRCAFYFYAGGLSWLAYRQFAVRPWPWRAGATMAGLVLVATCARHFSATHDVDFALNFEVPAVIFLFALHSRLLGRRISAAADALGNLTYASYLIHFPLQIAFMLAAGMLGLNSGFANSPAFLAGYLIGVFGLSHFVYSRFELPVQNALRARLTARESSAASSFGRAVAGLFLFGKK